MAFKHYTLFSLVFLAAASISISGAQARGVNLCAKADYPALCLLLVKGETDPTRATESVIYRLIRQTKKAKKHLSRFGTSQSQVIQVCQESYDDAIYDLHTCLDNLKSHDKAGFNSNLSAALTDYVTCDDAFGELGETSPVQNVNRKLRRMAGTGLYLETMVH
ncbi:hypothetical protein FNV43_RR25953 [Rhamnella rubrinervis]|uniref:Pectinesterase inhibitor domain-containing protein n=1 Tax=Rhamnella rubrinervis TaxID=2594499 RepID=A0A8K0DNE0_9ROSA|nr:hypothetical protein FNV43_RR25953 [Rhamnella rubrinervis]